MQSTPSEYHSLPKYFTQIAFNIQHATYCANTKCPQTCHHTLGAFIFHYCLQAPSPGPCMHPCTPATAGVGPFMLVPGWPVVLQHIYRLYCDLLLANCATIKKASLKKLSVCLILVLELDTTFVPNMMLLGLLSSAGINRFELNRIV